MILQKANADGQLRCGRRSARTRSAKFKPKSSGVWELVLPLPLKDLPKGNLAVSVKDKQGNLSKLDRTFSVGK